MAVRTVHSCDWCFRDAKKPNVVDEDWKMVLISLDGSEVKTWLCTACFTAYKLAIITVRDSRSNKV